MLLLGSVLSIAMHREYPSAVRRGEDLCGPERQAERAWAVQFAARIRRAIHMRNQQADDAFTEPDFVAAVAAIEAECDALLR